MDNREGKRKVTISALLHDIGKFYQRTGAKIENNYYLTFLKNNGYYHAAYTAQFIDKYVHEDFKAILKPAAEHHTATTGIIKEADKCSSGHDRKSEDIEKEEQADNYIVSRLNSIFDILYNYDNKKRHFINLDKNSKIYPNEKVNYNTLQNCKHEYDEFFKKFISEFNSLEYHSYLEMHHKIYPLIKEYTSSIPSASYNVDIPTVSLFDHLKLTAAFANLIDENTSYIDKEFLIVEYDLSGIQKFIYSITEGNDTRANVSKSLRTRSFYLNMLCDFIAYAIVNEFDLSYENVLYTSGGKGQVLLKNSLDTRERLSKLLQKISVELYKKNKLSLSFTFNTVELSIDDFSKGSFKELMYIDNKEMIIKKSQKFNNLFTDDNFSFEGDQLSKACSLCQINESKSNDICDFCNKLLDLNNFILAKTNSFVVEFDYNDYKTFSDVSFDFGSLGKINVYKSNDNIKINDNSYYLSINGYALGESKNYAISNITGMSFEDIADNSEGDPKIAVVKMDVDNLGFTFQSGFDKPTVSKILTLSRNMDLFFSKIMVDICNDKKFKKSVYIIYSGGDDMAIVLPASYALDFVEEINMKFKSYVGDNPKLSLSSGIEIFSPKSPIRFAILRADEMLDCSKRYEVKELGKKNATSLLNCSISNSRLSFINSEINYFTEGLNNNKLSRTSLYNIYIAILDSLENKNDQAFMRYIPQIAYSLSRNVEGEIYHKLKNIFVSRNVSRVVLSEYKIIFSMVLMKTRRGKNE